MKTKKKLLGTLAGWVISFMFIASWTMIGIVLALQEASVNLGGSIEFIAKDIYADITGRVTGTKNTVTLDDIHFSAETQTFETPTSWSNMDLTFDEDATPIEIQVTINNKSTHPLYVDFTEGTDYQNITVTRKKGADEVAKFNSFEISGGTAETPTSQILDITLKVTDMNNDSKGNLSLVIKLSSENPEQSKGETEYETLSFTYDETNKTAFVMANQDNLPTGDLAIPSKVRYNDEMYNVTSIGTEAFASCSSLQSITIPASVTNIETGAFAGCSSLTSITVDKNNSVYTSYENGIYKGTTLIVGCQTTIIKEGTTEIGSYAFRGQSNLTSITIPASVTVLDDYVFSSCKTLTSVTFAENSQLERIGVQAFAVCRSLESITIPASVTSVGTNAFYFCFNLQYNMYDNAKYLGNETNPYLVLINRTSGDITSCEINSATKVIAGGAFRFCSSIQSITIPASLTSIGDYAFSDCTNLSSVTFAKGSQLKCIGAEAFNKCSLLSSITIPASVTSVDKYAFSECSNLTSVTFAEGSQLKSIEIHAFASCTSLQSINIPAGVTSIGKFAFHTCSSLSSTTIPASVKSIGDRAFSNCTNLTSVTFAEGSQLDSIGEQAFYNCESLQLINIPASVTNIETGAFNSCTALNSVNFANRNGWTAGSTAISSSELENSTTAAEYLRSIYDLYKWTRS